MSSGGDGQRTTDIRNALDTTKLLHYINEHPNITTSLHKLTSTSPPPEFLSTLTAKQFGFGQSNPTYLLTATSHSPSTIKSFTYKFVMRKKPLSVAHPTAHNVAREHKLLTAISIYNAAHSPPHSAPRHHNPTIPIPTPIHLCTDPSIIGSDFYLMDFIQGRIFTDAAMPGLTKRERAAAWADAVRILGNIHSFDFANSLPAPKRSGGKRAGPALSSMAKSINRLLSVYEAQSKTAGKILQLPDIARKLMALSKDAPGGGGVVLPQTINESGTLIHGDYKIDNLIFHPTEPRVIAVLDWELWQINGDPLLDLANLSMVYHLPNDGGGDFAELGMRGLKGVDFGALSVPTEEALLGLYATINKTFTADELRRWSGFYLAFLFFKNVVISHGVKERVMKNTSSSSFAAGEKIKGKGKGGGAGEKVGKMVDEVVKLCVQMLETRPPMVGSKL